MIENTTKTGIYPFGATSISGEEIPMSDFEGQVLLVVNTASECGFTPQYAGLQELYAKYRDQGLTVLGFPCNQFGGQEPGSEKEIMEGCRVNYGVDFPMFSKVKVNGSDAHPLFKYLKRELPGLLGGRIKWNFTKFLVDRDGKPVRRFAPMDKPEALEPYIEELLKKK